MKSMVAGWIRDVTTYQNVFADHQIIHFYRYLSVREKWRISMIFILGKIGIFPSEKLRTMATTSLYSKTCHLWLLLWSAICLVKPLHEVYILCNSLDFMFIWTPLWGRLPFRAIFCWKKTSGLTKQGVLYLFQVAALTECFIVWSCTEKNFAQLDEETFHAGNTIKIILYRIRITSTVSTNYSCIKISGYLKLDNVQQHCLIKKKSSASVFEINFKVKS